MKDKLYLIYVLPLKQMWLDIREVAWFTRGLFR